MKIEPFKHHLHYPVIQSWWKAKERPPTEPWFLPPLGKIVSFDQSFLVAGFLYRTDGNIASIGALVATPVENPHHGEALEFLLQTLYTEAKNMGFGMVTAATNLPRLKERFVKLGLHVADENVSHFGGLL